jgi:hypothetical protein
MTDVQSLSSVLRNGSIGLMALFVAFSAAELHTGLLFQPVQVDRSMLCKIADIQLD